MSGSNPFILINGVRATQGELAALNPNIIKSISVLKGAAASAIYGSHAAFGAIIVTTKSGTKREDFTLNYSMDIGFNSLTYVPPTVSSLEFAKMANVASQNFSGTNIFTQKQIDRIRAYINGEIEHQTSPIPSNPDNWRGVGFGTSADWYTGYANTDWYDLVFEPSLTQKHNISISGGSENITYYFAGGFINNPGHFTFGGENEWYNRYNLNSNISVDLTDWLNITNITRYYRERNSFPGSLDPNERARYWHDLMRFAPITPWKSPAVRDDQGNVIVPEQLLWFAGWLENNGFKKYTIDNFVTNFKAQVDINDQFSIKGNVSFKKRFYHRIFNYKKWAVIGPTGKKEIVYQKNSNQITKTFRRTNYYMFNVYANYKESFNSGHNIDVMFGYQQEENTYKRVRIGRKGVVDNDLNSIDVAVGQFVGPFNPMTSFASIGWFGRLQYNYKQKYLVQFTGRYDGSSKFAPHHRFVFSPSVSAGYHISKEEFWDPISKYISNLKIRAAWGKLGNQEVGNNYLYISTIPIHTQLGWVIGGERPVYTTMPPIKSPNITWETVTTKNIGINIGFLDNKLTAKLNFYERDTENMFGPSAALPAVLGAAPPRTNSAALETKGWELSVTWQDQMNADLSYDITLMVSDNQTTITKYNNPNKVLTDYYVGQKLGEIWGYKTDGLFQTQEGLDEYLSKVDLTFLGTNWQPGNVKYLDLNGDGAVNNGQNTLANPGDRVIIGNSHPRYKYSIQLGVSWKNFDFYMLWQGVGKRDVWLDGYSSLFWGWNRKAHTHITEAVMDYWSPDNRDAYLPIPLSNSGRAGFGKDRHRTARYLQNGAYIRLKSVRISYTLPSSLTNKLNLNNLTVYIDGQNLLVITPMWPNIDPELADPRGFRQNAAMMAYPLSRVIGFGIDLSL